MLAVLVLVSLNGVSQWSAVTPAEHAASLKALVFVGNIKIALSRSDTLCVLLEMLGHETRVAYDGEMALTIAEEYKRVEAALMGRLCHAD